MRRRPLPGTTLEVSEVGLTLSNLSPSWWGTADPARIERLLLQAFDREVTLFDTADVAGSGAAESILGRALRSRRWQVTIATKGGYDFIGSTAPRFLTVAGRLSGGGEIRHAAIPSGHPRRERPQDFRPEALRRACESSLRRLGTDVIDLYQLHHPRLDALEHDAVWEALESLRREGKIRQFGVCLGPGPGWEEEGRLALERGCPLLQLSASPLDAGGLGSLSKAAAAGGAGLFVRDVHAFGLFGGPPAPPAAQDPAGEEGTGPAAPPEELLRAARGRLGRTGLSPGRPDAEAAAGWALSWPAVSAVLVRSRGEAELAEALAAGEAPPLGPEERDRVSEAREEILGRTPRLLPGSTAIRPTPEGSRVRE